MCDQKKGWVHSRTHGIIRHMQVNSPPKAGTLVTAADDGRSAPFMEGAAVIEEQTKNVGGIKRLAATARITETEKKADPILDGRHGRGGV